MEVQAMATTVVVLGDSYARIVTDQGDYYEFYGEEDGRPVLIEGCIETLRQVAERHLGLFPGDTPPWPGLLAPATAGVLGQGGRLCSRRTSRLREDSRRDDDCTLGWKVSRRSA